MHELISELNRMTFPAALVLIVIIYVAYRIIRWLF